MSVTRNATEDRCEPVQMSPFFRDVMACHQAVLQTYEALLKFSKCII